jgi:hypothetical protein
MSSNRNNPLYEISSYSPSGGACVVYLCADSFISVAFDFSNRFPLYRMFRIQLVPDELMRELSTIDEHYKFKVEKIDESPLG